MYGLKQSGRIGHKKLEKELQDMGFAKVGCDHSIWVYQKDGIKIIIPVFVDDMTIVSKSKDAIQGIKDELKRDSNSETLVQPNSSLELLLRGTERIKS
jgi:hypothetical protein